MSVAPNSRNEAINWPAAALIGVLATAAFSAPALPAPNPPSAREAAAIEAGRKLFVRCTACHALTASARPMSGPHLEGIVGRPVASVEGFPYTATLKGQSFVWTRDRLARWLRKPQDGLPGLCMPFTGLPRRSDRQALVAYLERPDSTFPSD